MIGCKELRLENWVAWCGEYVKEEQVKKIDIDHGHDWINGDDARFFRGIELTEEWLEKLGFDSDVDDYLGTERVFKIGLIAIYDHGDDVYSLYRYNDSRVRISYVHQLQNLYHSLTGQELKIKENEPA